MISRSLFFICTCATLLTANSCKNLKENSSNESTISIGVCQFHLRSYCAKSKVTFFLYTRSNQLEGEQIFADRDSNNLLQTAFNIRRNTKILIHGYNSDMFLEPLKRIKDEYFIKNKFNIIFVNWNTSAKGPCYPAAVWNCRMVGNCLSELIDAIRSISTSSIHLLGFSLGSHVAAFASNYVRSKKIERITGLDPALPGFITVPNENKLDRSDAEFVDVIHTNAFMQGTPLRSGHIDFFVNGGSIQPGCTEEGNVLACSHHRALDYYSESINSVHGFLAWACSSYWEYLIGRCWPSNNCTLMGEHVDPSSKGIFMVITNSQPDYAIAPKSSPPLRNLLQMNNEKLQQISNLLLSKILTFP